MFLFKKVISQFFFPMPLCLAFCFAGLFLLWFTKRQRAGKLLVSFGLLVLTTLSYGSVADALLRPLESKYPPYDLSSGGPAVSPKIKYVVVLGGGHTCDASLPISSQLSDESLKRLVEGIRVYRQNPGSKLILSGGRWLEPVSEADLMSGTARSLGVPSDDIVLESESKDTADEVRLLKPVLGASRFILVTSATHMPRSMLLFQRAGLDPEPAPAEHLVVAHSTEPKGYFPRGRNLMRCDRAAYEYLGLVWVHLRKKS